MTIAFAVLAGAIFLTFGYVGVVAASLIEAFTTPEDDPTPPPHSTWNVLNPLYAALGLYACMCYAYVAVAYRHHGA